MPLRYLPYAELERIRTLDGDPYERARLRPREPLPGPSGPRLRPDRRRRAPGGPALGVAAADREPPAARDHRDRRPQPGAVGHVGLAGERPGRPRGEDEGVRLGGR